MANTYTAYAPAFTVAGNMRMTMGTLTMTDGNGAVALGMENLYGGAVTPLTITTGGFGADFDATAGAVTITSAATGDTFNVLAFGS